MNYHEQRPRHQKGAERIDYRSIFLLILFNVKEFTGGGWLLPAETRRNFELGAESQGPKEERLYRLLGM